MVFTITALESCGSLLIGFQTFPSFIIQKEEHNDDIFNIYDMQW